MASPPRRPSQTEDRRTARRAVADRAVIAKPADPRQAGLFDEPLPKWIRPCLPTLVDKPPVGPAVGARDQMGRVQGLRLRRRRQGDDPHPQWPQLNGPVPGDRRGGRRAQGPIGGDRWRGRDPRRAGRSSFAELQADLDRHGSRRAVLYAFDLLFLNGEDLRKKPLEERRLALGSLIPKRSAILMSEEFSGAGADLFKIACENELEGIVSKRLDRAYRSGRSRDWLKTKCVLTERLRHHRLPARHRRRPDTAGEP